MDAPLYTAGIYLRSHPELRPAAAWNAGRIGYFSGGSVLNLDGLVNDRIYPYAKSDRLFDYVRLCHIRTILDFSLMMDPQVQRQYHQSATMRQLGITDGRLQACLTAQNPAGGAVTGDPENLPVLVYHMKPECER